MNLLVDIGNSRIKWVFLQDLRSTRVMVGEFASLENKFIVKNGSHFLKVLNNTFLKISSRSTAPIISDCQCIISSVACKDIENIVAKVLRKFLCQTNIPTIKVEPEKKFSFKWGTAVLKTSRENPASLGKDRWAALIGFASNIPLSKLKNEKVIIVSAGSVTVTDVVSIKKVDSGTVIFSHLGGFLTPGFGKMKDSLSGINQKLVSTLKNFSSLPNDTEDSSSSGIALSQISPLFHLKEIKKITLCGGYSEQYLESMNHFGARKLIITIDEWLIMRGLYWYSQNYS